GEIEMRKFQNVDPTQAQPTIKEFVDRFAPLRKDGGGYEVSPEYAQQEAWDIATAARVLEQATVMMSGEAYEPEHAKEVSDIIRAITTFIQGEINEMESAATGEQPSADG